MPYKCIASFYFSYLYFVQCPVLVFFFHASLLEALSKTNVPPSAEI